MFFNQLELTNLDWDVSEETTKKEKIEIKYIKRSDYCYDCNNEELYPHMMTLKCSQCHKIILGA